MEKSFTEIEKMAVANVLYNLIQADFQTKKGENECLKACLKELEFDATGFVPIARDQLPAQAYETLKYMTLEKKRIFSRMMTQISRSDTHFGSRERAFVREILEMCEVPFVHK